MAHFLGIDLGLSGARAAVLDSRGRIRGTGRCTTDASLRGTAEQNPEEWLSAISYAVREALAAADHPSIAAVGIGAFGPCAVTIDDRLRPTGPASLFAFDTRHEAWRRRLIESGIAEDQLGPDHVLPKVIRIKETAPDRFIRTAWVVDATGFVVASLTGVPVMDPVTWLDHTIEGVIPPRPIPETRLADSIAGSVTSSAAERFGIAPSIPVAVGSYDSYVDFFGAGVVEEGDAGILLGSTAVICRVSDRTIVPGPLRATPHIGGGRMIGGWTSSAGSLLSWAENLTGSARASGCQSACPGDSGLIMLPYFAGERAPMWDARARGALIGLTLSTTGEDIRRSALEAVALSVMDIARHLDAVCGPTGRLRVAGGGASIPGLAQAIADATGAVLEIVSHPGEACGGAILAAHAVGTPIERAVEHVVEPDPRNSARFEALMDIYRPLYGQLVDAMHRLSELAARRESQ